MGTILGTVLGDLRSAAPLEYARSLCGLVAALLIRKKQKQRQGVGLCRCYVESVSQEKKGMCKKKRMKVPIGD